MVNGWNIYFSNWNDCWCNNFYIFGANYFFKEIIKEKFLTRFKNLEVKFKKSEFIYLLIYRFIGGIPFALSNVLPCIFNVKSK